MCIIMFIMCIRFLFFMSIYCNVQKELSNPVNFVEIPGKEISIT